MATFDPLRSLGSNVEFPGPFGKARRYDHHLAYCIGSRPGHKPIAQIAPSKFTPGRIVCGQSCALPDVVTELPSDRLVSLETIPPCLSDVMKRLRARANQLVSNPEATAVLRVGIGRAFSEAALMFSAPDDPQIHYVKDLGSVTDILSSEWARYVSPDGDLGWSGFVLAINKDGTKIRLSTSSGPPMGSYETLLQLEAEFFPGKKLDIAAGTLETAR